MQEVKSRSYIGHVKMKVKNNGPLFHRGSRASLGFLDHSGRSPEIISFELQHLCLHES